MPPSRLGVIVLGMHRSGTSVVSRLLNLLGLSPGPDADLVPPSDSNPAGHWENASLNLVNQRLLAALGGHASAPPPLAEGWEAAPELERLRREAAALAGSVLAAEQWAWKDPRTCLTLPFWLRVLDVPVAAVLVRRHPLEVARSLEARDGRPLGTEIAARAPRQEIGVALDHGERRLEIVRDGVQKGLALPDRGMELR